MILKHSCGITHLPVSSLTQGMCLLSVLLPCAYFGYVPFFSWSFLQFFVVFVESILFYSFSFSLFPPTLHLTSFSVMPRFTEQVESAVEALSANPTLPVDENEFIDASRLVYDGIRDIRKAVLMIRVSRTVFFFPTSATQNLIFHTVLSLKQVFFYLK